MSTRPSFNPADIAKTPEVDENGDVKNSEEQPADGKPK